MPHGILKPIVHGIVGVMLVIAVATHVPAVASIIRGGR